MKVREKISRNQNINYVRLKRKNYFWVKFGGDDVLCINDVDQSYEWTFFFVQKKRIFNKRNLGPYAVSLFLFYYQWQRLQRRFKKTKQLKLSDFHYTFDPYNQQAEDMLSLMAFLHVNNRSLTFWFGNLFYFDDIAYVNQIESIWVPECSTFLLCPFWKFVLLVLQRTHESIIIEHLNQLCRYVVSSVIKKVKKI